MPRGAQPGERRGGRQKGTPNKASAAKAAEVASSGLTPLAYMVSVLQDNKLPPALRMDAAKAAAPYVHPKLSSIEHTGRDGGPIQTQELSELDRARRVAFLLATGMRARTPLSKDSGEPPDGSMTPQAPSNKQE